MSLWRKLWDQLRAGMVLSSHHESLECDLKQEIPVSGTRKYPYKLGERKYDHYGMEITAQYWLRDDTLDEFTARWTDPFTVEINSWDGCTVENFDYILPHVIEQKYPRA